MPNTNIDLLPRLARTKDFKDEPAVNTGGIDKGEDAESRRLSLIWAGKLVESTI